MFFGFSLSLWAQVSVSEERSIFWKVIIDDNRRLNAERLEAVSYSGRTANPEPVQKEPEVTQDDDTALLMRLLQDPEMRA